ncbi:Putative Fe-S cluster [Desulfacinum hydrothermale DSM 13146]|uniref:Putative Fe-S cluster n=1 Tax=Desulfacinum hydrothermale DSM 13146 TaxID=1121390 RepID=A0A1W1XDC4_9BACT|nr:DUF3786 domain-containing protein [Desulfacinum hydrothermale]SMC21648.1 Putative Fe-S cluster [Desulfacinum hydrothermale DSM 13146]
MDEEKRRMILNRITPIDLFKRTPKTNCGECAQPSCLAYATQAVVGEIPLSSCPYLDPEDMADMASRLDRQLQAGIGKKRESFEKTLEFLREEMAKWDLEALAPQLGAEAQRDPESGMARLRIAYLGDQVEVSRADVRSLGGRQISPWEKIFLFNYVIGGAVDPSGTWVGMESLPNSISKIKSLQSHCEEPLAKAFPQDRTALARAVSPWFSELEPENGQADWAGECRVLPKVSLRLLWWAEDPEDGFPARVKFLFDKRILDTLDLESLLFACEEVTERILNRRSPETS